MESDQERGAEDDELVEEQAELAAREAGEIGGRRDPGVDPAEQAVLEHGGGVAEGFEQAEEQLRARAEHEDPAGNPKYDRSAVEEEPTDTVYGEADHVISTETEDERASGPD